MKNIVKLAHVGLLLGTITYVQAVSAERVLLHTEPIRSSQMQAEFKVNPNRSLAAVHVVVDHDTSSDEINVHTVRIKKKIDGLTYNPATKQVLYKDTVCGTLGQRSFLAIKKHTLHETGACQLIKEQKRELVDNGFDDPHLRTLTELYLHLPN